MKALLRLSLAVFFLFATGQYTLQAQFVPEPFKPEALQKDNAGFELKNQEEVIWWEDFDGELPEGWLNVDNNGFCGFQHTYSGPQGPFSVGMPPLNSQTADNGFMILDSDLCSSQSDEGGATDAWLQSPPIDLSDYHNVMLRFQHNFRFCCSPAETLLLAEVSTDGENWTSFDVRNGLSPNNTSANPVHQAINISDIAAGEEQVWVRFRKTGATHYWWMIDDVMLVSFIENDLEITQVHFNHGYTQVPMGQQQAFRYAAEVRNAGGMPQTGVVLSAEVNRLLFTSSSQEVASMAPAQQLTLRVQDDFLAPAPGLYHAVLQLHQDQEDQVPASNSAEVRFLISDSVYARTSAEYDAATYITLSEEVQGAGNIFTLVEDTELTSVAFALHENSANEGVLIARVYRKTENSYTQVWEMQHTIAADDITQEDEHNYIVLGLNEPLELESGDYLAEISLEEGAEIILAAQSIQGQPDGASLVRNNNQWSQADAVPVILLHMGNNVAECDPQYGFVIENALCGTASGAVEVVPLTGIGPFVFAWDDDSELDSPLRENLEAGEYTLTVTDGYGCEKELTVVVEDEEIVLEYEVTDAICGEGGVARIIPLNGQEPFSFSWSHDSETDEAHLVDLDPGTYTVIFSDANNCIAEITFEIENINVLPVDISTQTAWCGSATGSIELTPTAGTAPYTFTWSGQPDIDGPLAENMLPGVYDFIVSDDTGCENAGSATVVNQNYTLNVGVDVTDATCGLANGVLNASVANGQGPYTYQWSNGLSGEEIENIAPGTYEVLVYDEFGCEGTREIIVDNIGAMPSVTYVIVDSENCGEATGSISVFADDPAAQYTVSLLNGDKNLLGQKDEGGDNGGNGNGDDSIFSLHDLPSGQYILSVTAEDGCENILVVNVSDSGAPEIEAQVQHISCYGETDGQIAVSITGGTDPQYLWNDPASSTGTSIDQLGAGIYTLELTDGDCFAVESFEVIEPKQLAANAILSHIVCANDEMGSIVLQTTGGRTPYSHIWSNGFSGSNLQDVAAGTYSVKITDYSYCEFEATYTITANEPLEMNTVINHATPGASNGSISVSVSGGVGPYVYLWNTGHQVPQISGLATGSYTITVTDQEGCEVEEVISLGTVSTDNQTFTEGIRVYPNPVENRLHIVSDDFCHSAAATAQVFTIMGEKVMQRQLDSADLKQGLTIETGNLAPGVYILNVRCGEQNQQARFMKK